jgi:hypothetical protein
VFSLINMVTARKIRPISIRTLLITMENKHTVGKFHVPVRLCHFFLLFICQFRQQIYAGDFDDIYFGYVKVVGLFSLLISYKVLLRMKLKSILNEFSLKCL